MAARFFKNSLTKYKNVRHEAMFWIHEEKPITHPALLGTKRVNFFTHIYGAHFTRLV